MLVIDGGNHAGFGSYGRTRMDRHKSAGRSSVYRQQMNL